MKTKVDIHYSWDCWTDPGGHDGPRVPNGRPYVECVEGAIMFEAEGDEPLPPIEELIELVSDELWPVRVESWIIDYGRHTASFTPRDYDASQCEYEPEEPDYDSMPGGWDDY